MTNERLEGNWNETKGKVKEGVGDATDNERLEREGEADQLQGKVQKGLADIQDTLQDAGDRISDEVDRRR
jgi:uncharacterized protein YjbJ (UPF0337 family)